MPTSASSSSRSNSLLRKEIALPVLVAALGYFVDVYDLILFSIVRVPSLKSLGLDADGVLKQGYFLINMQMAGMLIGGILWGIVGDKKGRINVLFGSILLYSAANIANGFVHSIGAYAIWRFIAGIGLAGELGAGITLVSEILPKEKRGIGTTIVASVGICGAVLAYFVAEAFDWRAAFVIGGVMGFMLLLLRVSTMESGLFRRLKGEHGAVARGSLVTLLRSRERLGRFLCCVLTGLPVWYVIGILVTAAPEIAAALGGIEPVEGGRAVMLAYVGLAAGDLASGLLSQWLRRRKSVIFIYVVLCGLLAAFYTLLPAPSAQLVYVFCVALGFSVGYWAVFVTVAAEQFGTNLRATVATSVPNLVRGSLVILSNIFLFFKEPLGLIGSVRLVGVLAVGVALLALWKLEETFHKDLDFLET